MGQPKLFTGLPASSNAALNVEPVHASLPMRIQPVSKRRYVPQRSGSISLALIQPFSWKSSTKSSQCCHFTLGLVFELFWNQSSKRSSTW